MASGNTCYGVKHHVVGQVKESIGSAYLGSLLAHEDNSRELLVGCDGVSSVHAAQP